MNKTRFAALLAAAVMLLLVVVFFGEGHDPELEGQMACVDWEYVNLRVDHSTSSKSLGELSYGTVVTLTGNTYEALGGCPELVHLDAWVEVELNDGTTGWVVTTSLDY